MRIIVRAILFLTMCLIPRYGNAAQIVAGTMEDQLFQRITAENDTATKLQMAEDFVRQFPQSKVLPDVYLFVIDVYRQKGDRAKMIEYGEKVLDVDANNITALMVLSRNYAIEGKNVERAVDLAQKAVDLVVRMKATPYPARYTASQWKDYIQTTEGAARNILAYATAVRGH